METKKKIDLILFSLALIVISQTAIGIFWLNSLFYAISWSIAWFIVLIIFHNKYEIHRK